ncbi:hypothetical protein [Nitrosospira sp. NRS527]|uniref:hypothetical protein n=1 Tax=Nitrosospira sp. NRS527 TaxID=155925 RepID=UPI001AF83AD6|nr:hypothetical protein [Nitrosospira sp. NRS527]BCT68089.1 hypothetical protein NNRS527_01681 [Nitrosospira sp. NRS527]
MERIAKLDAASRQLNAAISLLFDGADPIVVHTLTVAASNIFSDVIDKRSGTQSWREKMRIDHGVSKAAIKNIMQSAWNFFKHGDRDPEGILEFDKSESEYLVFFATLECGELQSTSIQMQTFQFWFLASGAFDLCAENEIQKKAELIFPGLSTLPRSQKLSIGAEMLAKQLEGFRAET